MLVAQLCPTHCDPTDCSLHLICPLNSPGQNTGGGCHALLQRSFPTRNPGLLHCRRILYRPRQLEAQTKVPTCSCGPGLRAEAGGAAPLRGAQPGPPAAVPAAEILLLCPPTSDPSHPFFRIAVLPIAQETICSIYRRLMCEKYFFLFLNFKVWEITQRRSNT